MSSEAERLLTTPNQHFLSFEGSWALFLSMDRECYHRSAFLDGRAESLSPTPVRQPLEPLVAAAKSSNPQQLSWIFHVAHCGSTLLARLIDSIDSSLVLREPPPLRQLGMAAAKGDCSVEWNGRLRLAHAMAARRYNPARNTIVKANVPVNFMLESLHTLDPDAPTILLYRPLEEYLVSILRSHQHRMWVERVTEQTGPALTASVGLLPGSGLADRAAALWLFQMLAFQSRLETGSKACSLNAGMLFDFPVDSARAAAGHLGAIDADVESNAASLAGKYAKNTSHSYNDANRRSRDVDDRRHLHDEIASAKNWLSRSPKISSLPARLGNPLLGDPPPLLR